MTTRRYDIIQAHAAHLLAQAGGVGHIDNLAPDARRYALLSLYKQLQADPPPPHHRRQNNGKRNLDEQE